MRRLVTKVVVAVAVLAAPAIANAEPISAFSLFGGASTILGSNVDVNSGLVGSNASMTINGGTDFIQALGAGILSGGSNLIATGDIIFNGNVTLGGGTQMTGDIDSGGNVEIGSNATINGSIRAAGTVTVLGGADVTGDIDAGAGAGTAVTVGSNATVGGTITHNVGTTTSIAGSATVGGDVTGTPDAPATYSTTVLPTPTIFVSGGASHNLGGGSDLTLAPNMSYDDIQLGSNSHLRLSAGTYYFDTWNLLGGTTIHFDLTGGDILLYFTGLVSLGSNTNVTLINGDASDIYTETKGGFSALGGSEWFGTIYASGADAGGDIFFGSNTDIFGALWATRNLEVQGGSDIDFILSDYYPPIPGIAQVPEPATLMLLGLGLVGLAVRARARTR